MILIRKRNRRDSVQGKGTLFYGFSSPFKTLQHCNTKGTNHVCCLKCAYLNISEFFPICLLGFFSFLSRSQELTTPQVNIHSLLGCSSSALHKSSAYIIGNIRKVKTVPMGFASVEYGVHRLRVRVEGK